MMNSPKESIPDPLETIRMTPTQLLELLYGGKTIVLSTTAASQNLLILLGVYNTDTRELDQIFTGSTTSTNANIGVNKLEVVK